MFVSGNVRSLVKLEDAEVFGEVEYDPTVCREIIVVKPSGVGFANFDSTTMEDRKFISVVGEHMIQQSAIVRLSPRTLVEEAEEIGSSGGEPGSSLNRPIQMRSTQASF